MRAPAWAATSYRPTGQKRMHASRPSSNFKIMLAGKIDTNTRLELLLGGEYVWLETRPAVRFEIDRNSFVIAGGKQVCEPIEECGDQLLPLAPLALSDPQFEDRLLAAVGAASIPSCSDR